MPFSSIQSTLGALLAGSVAAIAIAFGFEYIGGYHPCPLCLMERYAYYFAIVAAALALAGPRADMGHGVLRVVLAAIAVGYVINAGLGAYHAGVEWKWWAGPNTCTAALPSLSGGGVSLDQSAPVIRCDAAPWTFAGLSFAGWNAVISLAMAVFAVAGLRRAHSGA